jgi:hypothetical protein
MSFDANKLLELLPATYRVRDQEVAAELGLARGPLAELLEVIAEQIAVVEEDLEQLHDDAFIETCADWVVPYIGDLIGYRTLHGVAPRVANARAEVAHTIAYRRRKGTALVLEQLARDVTGWNASVAEYFQRVVTTQYMNHRRAWLHAAPDLRRWEPLTHVGSAFDRVPRTVDVRRIASGRGRHNIPNVGLFVWPLRAHGLRRSPAARVDDRRWRVSALNHDAPLVTRPRTEDDITHLATPLDVPARIGRRVMHERTADFYGTGPLRQSASLYVGTVEPLPAIPLADVCVCDLSDDGATWAHLPDDRYAIDPVLGRVALPPGLPAGTRVALDSHYACGADLGGGEYERADSFADQTTVPLRVPQDHATIQAALSALGGAGVVQITNSGRYEEALSIDAAAGARIELRAANGCRPTVILTDTLELRGGADSEIAINGLLLAGEGLAVPADAGNELARLELRHCTLVPGYTLDAGGAPGTPGAVSLGVAIPNVALRARRCLLGALRVMPESAMRLEDCVLDATAATRVAFAAPDGDAAGGSLSLDGCTVIGKLRVRAFPLISNSIVLARLGPADTWATPVMAERRQQGCVRFSLLPADARVPRRFRCLPSEAVPAPVPRFVSLRYGTAAYAQLGPAASAQIQRGADDEGEMGVYHHVHRPQRETNLRLRLDEYLRVGLEAGVFHQS